MMPLSEVMAYNTTEDFITAAQHLESVATHREDTYFDVRQRAAGVQWTGVSADALHDQIAHDLRRATHTSDDLREAARVARTGASDVDYAHRQMLYKLQDVQADGYSVAEGYVTTDIKPSGGLLEQAQRQQKALEHTADLQYKATQFAETDARAGARLQTAVGGEGKVQFVDHAFKTDGGDYDPNQGGGNFERKFWNDVVTDAIAGAAAGVLIDGVGAVPGALVGGSWAAIKDGLHFIAGDGHDY